MFKRLILLSLTIAMGVSVIGLDSALANRVEEGVDRKQPISIFIVGDSTVSNYTSKFAPQAGWGQFIGNYFSKEVKIKNHAIGGRSSKSFINEGRLDKVLNEIQPHDYLFIQFGHNDATKEKPERYADADTTYKECLKKIIDGAWQRGAIPILITPVAQRKFDKDGNILATHGKYPDAMKAVGQEENVLVIDLATVSRNYFGSLGPEKTKTLFMHLNPGESPNYPEGRMDDTHFQENGANEVAKLIIGEIQKTNIDLKKNILSGI